MKSTLEATRLKNVKPGLLASPALLKSPDAGWECVAPPLDGVLEPSTCHLKNLKITCATCGVDIYPADVEPGLLRCPDCDSEFFYVKRILEPEIIDGSGMTEIWVSDGGYVFIYPNGDLPLDAEIRYTVTGYEPKRTSTLYERPFLCPMGSDIVKFIICLDAQRQTSPQTIHIHRKAVPYWVTNSYTCPVCKARVSGKGEYLECLRCGFARVFSQGLSADIYAKVKCKKCGKYFHANTSPLKCPYCRTSHYFSPVNPKGWQEASNLPGNVPPPPPRANPGTGTEEYGDFFALRMLMYVVIVIFIMWLVAIAGS